MTMNYKGFYTKKGMTQAVERAENGTYKKSKLTEDQIQNFKLAEKLQIGVCIQKLNKDQILMNGGIVLNRYLKQWRRIPVEPQQKTYYKNGVLCSEIFQFQQVGPHNYLSNRRLIQQLDEIMKIMRQNKIAHTDLKPQNLVVIQRGGYLYSTEQLKFKDKCRTQNGLLLIDNDSIRSYGSMRVVGTPGVNCNHQMDKIQIVDQNTDKMGYNFVVKFINSFDGPDKYQ